ncbi:MAG: efflux transporter outer membrane subunit [Gallionellaceae bacterium]|nr:efflux transporter outer membrane subunit [Gallionellaceae bacterium]
MIKRLPLALLSAAVLSACAVGPDYQRPDLALPGVFPAQQDAKTVSKNDAWWHIYQDTVLNQLEDEALQHNADMQLAVSRIDEARAQADAVGANLYPTVSASVSANRTKRSLATATSLPTTTFGRITNDRMATLDVSYELDLWGRLRRSNEAAQAQLLGAESARDTVRLSLTAEVAQQYFALLAYTEQEALLKRALEGREKALELQRKRAELGVISNFDIHAAETEAAAFRAEQAAMTQAREQQEAVLAVLLGRSPRDVMQANFARGTPATPGVVAIPEGLSSELLLQRPDVREAEQQLVAFNANIGAVRAQMFPSVSLTGYLGGESAKFSDLFTSPAGIFQFAANLTQPLFNAGGLQATIRAAEAQRDQALIIYKQTVAAAFSDVRNALSGQEAARRTLEAAIASDQAMTRAYEQIQARYKAGVSSQLDLLDAERNALQAGVTRRDAERAQRSAVANFYKAIGG